jgi:hypothetical protein
VEVLSWIVLHTTSTVRHLGALEFIWVWLGLICVWLEHKDQRNNNGDDHNQQDRANCKPSPASGVTFTSVVFRQVSIIGNTSGDFFAFILHIPIGNSNWINDDCIVCYLTELIPLAEQLIALAKKPLLRTKPSVLFLRVNDACNDLDGRFLSGCNRRFLPFGPFIIADSRNSVRTGTLFYMNVATTHFTDRSFCAWTGIWTPRGRDEAPVAESVRILDIVSPFV